MNDTVENDYTLRIEDPKYEWKCEMFGMGDNFVLSFQAGQKIPNKFFRWMQFVLFGCKWIKEEE